MCLANRGSYIPTLALLGLKGKEEDNHIQPLYSVRSTPGTVLAILRALTHSVLPSTLWESLYRYPWYREKKTEAQRGVAQGRTAAESRAGI